MELIASSRIVKAQQRVESSCPYAIQLTKAMEDLAQPVPCSTRCSRIESPSKAGILVVTSDRGLAGAYNANVLKIAEGVVRDVRTRGLEPVLYAVGKKGIGYFRFRACRCAGAGRGSARSAVRGGAAHRPDADQGLRGRGDRRGLHRLPLRVHAARDDEAVPADRARGGHREGLGVVHAEYLFEPEPDEILDHLLRSTW